MPRPSAAIVALVLLAGPAAAQQLPPDKLEEIKRATVLVKVTNGELGGTGSGFVVRVVDRFTGYVVTNNHVIDFNHGKKEYRKPGELREEYVEVVFNSGAADELTCKAEVVAADPDRDLGVLKVRSPHPIPKPLDLSNPPKLVETLPVITCGFPFGEHLSTNARNPAITIGRATISSIRTNNIGDPQYVQLDGSLNPGNSGGPAVTTDGRLVGVVAMGILGSGIGLAIPHQQVSLTLAGRLGSPTLFAAPVDADTVELKIDVPLVDPFRNIARVRAYYRTVESGARPPQLDKSGRWARIPGGTPVELAVKDGWAQTAVRLPRDGKPSLWVQFEYADRRGGTFLLGTTEHTMPAFGVKDGPSNGAYLTANRVAAGTGLGAKTGTVTLKDVNTHPDQFVGTRVTFDGAVSGAVKRDGPLPELAVMFDKKTKVANLRFTAPASLADQVEKTVGKDAPPVPARVVGTVFAPDGADPRCVVEIQEVRLLGEDGTETASLKPLATATGAAAPTQKAESPAPASGQSPAAAEPTGPAPAGDFPMMPLAIAGGVTLMLLGAGAGVLLARRGRAPTPLPVARHVPAPPADTPPPGAASPHDSGKRETARRVRF